MQRSKTRRTALVVALWVALAAVIVAAGIIRYESGKRLLYWQGSAYVFRDEYAQALPEDAEVLGQAQFKRYRSSLGEDLTTNLTALDPELLMAADNPEFGQAYYSPSEGRILVAVQPSTYPKAENPYCAFYPK